MPRHALIAVALGLASAVLYLSSNWGPLAALVIPLATPLPLMLMGLGAGLAAAAISVVVAVAVIAVGLTIDHAILYAATEAAPALLVIRFALLSRATADGGTEWYPPGRILAWLTLYGAAIFSAFALVQGEALVTAISSFVDQLRAGFSEATLAGQAAAPVMAMVKQILPFVTVSVWLVVIIANAVVGQKLLVRMGRARRPSPELAATRLPGFMAPATVAAAALTLVSSGWLGFVATNVALILCVPFFLTGLAVLHAVSARWNGRTVILVATYLLLLLFGWPLIVVAGLGFMEHWVGLRDKLAGPGPGKERNE